MRHEASISLQPYSAQQTAWCVQGLSHYLEHMLFMGSKKYPDENEYDAYISNNGGMANAYTELVRLTAVLLCCQMHARSKYTLQLSLGSAIIVASLASCHSCMLQQPH